MPNPPKSVKVTKPTNGDSVKRRKSFKITVKGKAHDSEKPRKKRSHGVAIRVFYRVNGFPFVQTYIQDAAETNDDDFDIPDGKFNFVPAEAGATISVRTFAWQNKNAGNVRQPPSKLSDIVTDTPVKVTTIV